MSQIKDDVQTVDTARAPFQYVTNIIHDGVDKISFWVGNVDSFNKLNRTRSQKNRLAFIPVLCLLLSLYSFTFHPAIGVATLCVLLPIGSVLSYFAFFRNPPFYEVRLHFDRRLQRLMVWGMDLSDDYMSLKRHDFYIDHPTAIKIAVRHFSPIWGESGRAGYQLLTLDVTGDGGAAGEHQIQINNHAVVDYQFVTTWDVQTRCDELATAFQFLVEWLDLPLVVEPYMMEEYSNVRHYF